MTWDNWDDVQLTDEQLIEAASQGAEEALHKMKVAAQTHSTPVDRVETLSDEELLAEWQAEASKIEQAEHDQKAFESARQFVAECPRYVESEYNAVRIDAFVKAKYGADYIPTPDDLHAVFDTLADRDLLQTREIPRSPRPVKTDDDLYAMSLDELEQLANEDARQPGRYRRVSR